MRRTEPVRVGEVLDEWLSRCPGIARKIAEAKIPDLWPQVVGAVVAGYTLSLEIERGILYVKMSSSVVRNELFMRRDTLRDAINAALGADVVHAIIVK